MENIINELKTLDLKQLLELEAEIKKEIEIKRTGKKYQLELNYNRYKGSGKCWVAEVDLDTKKILGFIDSESNIKHDNYKGYKVFLLKDGNYLSCETGTKSCDNREYFKIINGEIEYE